MSWPIIRKLKMTTILVQKIRFICFNLRLSPVEIAIILLSITLSAWHIPITMHLVFWSGFLLKRLDLAEFLASELFFVVLIFMYLQIYRYTLKDLLRVNFRAPINNSFHSVYWRISISQLPSGLSDIFW